MLEMEYERQKLAATADKMSISLIHVDFTIWNKRILFFNFETTVTKFIIEKWRYFKNILKFLLISLKLMSLQFRNFEYVLENFHLAFLNHEIVMEFVHAILYCPWNSFSMLI